MPREPAEQRSFITLTLVSDRGNPPEDGDYEAVLAEFLSDRGRWPQLGDFLERERRADIEASYIGVDEPTADTRFSPPTQASGSEGLSP